MSNARRTVEVAEEVATLLRAEGAKVAVIGAMALAAHGYVRRTGDFDPLGGALVAEAEDASPVEVVNYLNPFTPRHGNSPLIEAVYVEEAS